MSEYLRVIEARDDDSAFRAFKTQRYGLGPRAGQIDLDLRNEVHDILHNVGYHDDGVLATYERRGAAYYDDGMLVKWETQLDCPTYTREHIRVSEDDIEAAYEKVSAEHPEHLAALKSAIENVRAYHEREVQQGWREDIGGLSLGSRVRPLESVGIYVPAGQAPLPSSLYMCAVPAQVAGVKRLAVCSPPRRDGNVDPLTLVAAKETHVTEVYRLGGAQAIGAMAWGSKREPETPGYPWTVAPVDKIVGPGNRWVVEAKRQVFGAVGIDSLAGPSESAMIADDSADPELVAADLLSQAEHSGDNTVVLLTPSERLAAAVQAAIPAQVATLERAELIGRSLQEQGALVLVRDLAHAAALVSELAPEHLELAVQDPEALAERVENAGCIFLGHRAAVPLGDYAAGPSHVLPTGGTARFSSPLSVQDFVKRTSLVGVSEEGLRRIGPDVIALAEAEGLTAHAEAVRRRLQ